MADSEKYVVMSTMVNDWPAGTVIHRNALRIAKGRDAYGGKAVHPQTGEEADEHDQLERLISLGAIRPASEAESKLASVPATQAGLTPAQTLALQTLDATYEKLTQDVAAHEERARAHERLRGGDAPLPSPEEDPAFAMAIQERRAKIEHLQERLKTATGRADEHREALAEQSKRAAERAPKSGDIPLTGQAVPAPDRGGERPPGQQQTNEQREQAARDQAQAAERQRQDEKNEQLAEAERQRQAEQAEQAQQAQAGQRQRQEQEARRQADEEQQRQRKGKRGGGEQ